MVAFAQTGTVKVQVTGIQSGEGGELSAGIFEEGDFPKVGQSMIMQEIAVSGEEMEVVFEEVPVGTYALAIYQDIDQDKDLKTNILGFPREPIGFSNNVVITLGPPSFESAAVEVKVNEVLSLSIELR